MTDNKSASDFGGILCVVGASIDESKSEERIVISSISNPSGSFSFAGKRQLLEFNFSVNAFNNSVTLTHRAVPLKISTDSQRAAFSKKFSDAVEQGPPQEEVDKLREYVSLLASESDVALVKKVTHVIPENAKDKLIRCIDGTRVLVSWVLEDRGVIEDSIVPWDEASMSFNESDLRDLLKMAIKTGKPVSVVFKGTATNDMNAGTFILPKIIYVFLPNGTIEGKHNYESYGETTVTGTFDAEKNTMEWHEVFTGFKYDYSGTILAKAITGRYVCIGANCPGKTVYEVNWDETRRLRRAN
eukprot:TRINITY_DN14620_c0_g2_i1.p2 TRINITY_DN14620_c0_g2~~TRINITY_DN14620_c0_g2_i1.p2  ORF type:complete len:300 (-),score=81.48 TRINITY_DN14620_c0_g2_i1:1030-1929(-)